MFFSNYNMVEGWKISIDKLIHPDEKFDNYSFSCKMFESASQNLGLLLYDIAEIRMGWE